MNKQERHLLPQFSDCGFRQDHSPNQPQMPLWCIACLPHFKVDFSILRSSEALQTQAVTLWQSTAVVSSSRVECKHR